MGCENSQMVETVPYEPHNLPQEQPNEPQKGVAPASEHHSHKHLSSDKENAHPTPSKMNNQRKESKKIQENQAGVCSQEKKKSKSECHLEENPMAEVTNCVGKEETAGERGSKRKDSKVMSVRSIAK